MRVVEDGRGANAKSTMKIMTLDAKKDDRIFVRAERGDAEAAEEALVDLIPAEEE